MVVGLVFAAILAFCIVFCIRRRRRIRRHKWLAEMHPQRPSSIDDDPFRDNVHAIMRSVDTNAEGHWDRKGTPEREGYGHGYQIFGQAKNDSVNPAMIPIFQDGTFEKRQLQAIDNASSPEPNRRSRSSTPSVYPATLSPGEDEQVSENIVSNLHRSSSVPPRPPRSHLRERVKSLERMPPSLSVSESSSPRSPVSISPSYHFLRRKPIPDVRLDFPYG